MALQLASEIFVERPLRETLQRLNHYFWSMWAKYFWSVVVFGLLAFFTLWSLSEHISVNEAHLVVVDAEEKLLQDLPEDDESDVTSVGYPFLDSLRLRRDSLQVLINTKPMWNVAASGPGWKWDTTWADAQLDLSFVNPGQYVLSVSPPGCRDILTSSVIVYDAPVACFYIEPEMMCHGHVVPFNNASCGDAAIAWNWSFGDGDTTIAIEPPPLIHSYGFETSCCGSAADTMAYYATLLVNNACGTETAKEVITVYPADTTRIDTTLPAFKRIALGESPTSSIAQETDMQTNDTVPNVVPVGNTVVDPIDPILDVDQFMAMQGQINTALNKIVDQLSQTKHFTSRSNHSIVDPSFTQWMVDGLALNSATVNKEIGRLQGLIVEQELRLKKQEEQRIKEKLASIALVKEKERQAAAIAQGEKDKRWVFGFWELFIAVLTGALGATFTDGGKAIAKKYGPRLFESGGKVIRRFRSIGTSTASHPEE